MGSPEAATPPPPGQGGGIDRSQGHVGGGERGGRSVGAFGGGAAAGLGSGAGAGGAGDAGAGTCTRPPRSASVVRPPRHRSLRAGSAAAAGCVAAGPSPPAHAGAARFLDAGGSEAEAEEDAGGAAGAAEAPDDEAGFAWGAALLRAAGGSLTGWRSFFA